MRISLYVCTSLTSILLLSGCVGDEQAPVARADFENNCAVCHNLDGSPTPLGPQNVQLGPNTCNIVDCSDVAALADYIEDFMPPAADLCVADCAQNTAQFISNNFQEDPVAAAISQISSVLSSAEVSAFDQATGENVAIEVTAPASESAN